jgi:hypothetical protein
MGGVVITAGVELVVTITGSEVALPQTLEYTTV